MQCCGERIPYAADKTDIGLSRTSATVAQAELGPSPFPELDQYIASMCNQVLMAGSECMVPGINAKNARCSIA